MTGDEHPRDPEDREDDPFAFRPDERDEGERPADEAPGARGAGDGAPDAPGPGAPDAGDAADRRGRGRRRPRTAEETERIRTVADEASQRAQRVGVRWLAVAGIVLVLLAGVSTLTGRDTGEQGGDVQAGETLPPFAAPLATRPELRGQDDVNVADADGQGERGRRAACSITSPSAVTSCALLRRGPLVLVLFSRGIDECVTAVDELDLLRTRHPRLQTLAVATLGRHDPTAETVRDRRWTLPVAYDRDAGLATLLGAPACPLVLFVRQDGTVAQRIIGRVGTAELERGIRALLRPATPATTTVDAAAPGR